MTMRTLHSVVKRGALYWDRALLPEAMYRDRLEQIQTEIQAAGDDAWLMMGDVERHAPVVYATNFMPRVRSALAYVPRLGDPILLANISTRDIPAAKTITFIEDIRAFGKISKDLVAMLEQQAGIGAKIGLAGVSSFMPYPEWEAIIQARPDIVWSQRDERLQALRTVKNKYEAAAIQRAASIAAAALDKAPSILRPGSNLRIVLAELEKHCRAQGAEDARFMVACGAQAGIALRPSYDQDLKAGDTVLVFLAVQNQRYWAEAARSFQVGASNDMQSDVQKRCLSALLAMRAACKAGVAARDIADIAQTHLGDLAESASLYGFGGGIGLDHEEGTKIHCASTGRLSAGETLALRVIAHNGSCGAAFGETIQVTETGADVFNAASSAMVSL